MVDELVRGPIWRNVAFNVLTPKFTDERLERELKKFLNYYLSDREYSKNACFFSLKKGLISRLLWRNIF